MGRSLSESETSESARRRGSEGRGRATVWETIAVRLILGGVGLLSCAVLAYAQPPARIDDAALASMRFEWKHEGPAEVCGNACRTWISASGAITTDTPKDFEKFAEHRDVRGATLAIDSGG